MMSKQEYRKFFDSILGIIEMMLFRFIGLKNLT